MAAIELLICVPMLVYRSHDEFFCLVELKDVFDWSKICFYKNYMVALCAKETMTACFLVLSKKASLFDLSFQKRATTCKPKPYLCLDPHQN